MEYAAQPHILSDAEAEAIVSLRHPDPHAVLGMHVFPGGVVIRAFRPGAEEVRAFVQGEVRPLHPVHPSGIFELVLPDLNRMPAYLLEAGYPGNRREIFRDPYSFQPALGESGFRIGESGRQEDAWNRMGAHDGSFLAVPGVAFAAWEPQAEGVSVSGDFNGWDPRLHQLRRTGATGLWEIFIPAISASMKYRFEVRRPGTPLRLS